MNAELHDKRKDDRTPSYFLVDYSSNSIGPDKFHKAVTLNLSETGMCILAFNALHAGEKIMIKNDVKKCNPATVCWSKKLDENIYKLGLFFN